jgi:hypothetical protein
MTLDHQLTIPFRPGRELPSWAEPAQNAAESRGGSPTVRDTSTRRTACGYRPTMDAWRQWRGRCRCPTPSPTVPEVVLLSPIPRPAPQKIAPDGAQRNDRDFCSGAIANGAMSDQRVKTQPAPEGMFGEVHKAACRRLRAWFSSRTAGRQYKRS